MTPLFYSIFQIDPLFSPLYNFFDPDVSIKRDWHLSSVPLRYDYMYFWRTNGKFNQCFCVRSYFSAKWNEALNEHENCIQKEQHSSTHFSFFVRTVAEYEECQCAVRLFLDFCFISYDQWTLFSFEIVVKHVHKKKKKSHLHYWLNSSKIFLIPSCIF